MDNPFYFVIFNKIRKKYKLTFSEYAVIETIRILSTTNPDFPWCTASKQQIAKELGIAERTVFKAIDKAVKLNLIEKHKKLPWIRTTAKWNRNVYYLKNSVK